MIVFVQQGSFGQPRRKRRPLCAKVVAWCHVDVRSKFVFWVLSGLMKVNGEGLRKVG